MFWICGVWLVQRREHRPRPGPAAGQFVRGAGAARGTSGALEELFSFATRFTYVREQVEERSHGDPVPDLLVHTVEQLMQCLLRGSVRALKVGVVAAPHDVLVTHP